MDALLRRGEVVDDCGSKPAPPPGSGSQPEQPARRRLPMTHHVRKVLHDAPQVAPVHVRKEACVRLALCSIFELSPGRTRHVLNRSFAIERDDRLVRDKSFVGLEALPKVIRRKVLGWR